MPDTSNIAMVVLVVHAVCSAITATTPTPPPSSPWAWAYKIIEILGLVTGRAKDK